MQSLERGFEMVSKKYVLITPARDEEEHIEKTITSVIAQTILPKRWIIVSDHSQDGTDAIVRQYARKHDWIDFIRMEKTDERNFAAKVKCFNVGYERVRHLNFDIIGNLDADTSFGPDYLEFLLGKFDENPNLGVAGTPFVEDGYSSQQDSYWRSDVPGACQLFRRECFDAIGGYQPANGGIDRIAVTSARMMGWETRAFLERNLFHHRKLGTGEGNILKAKFKYGQKDYYLGNHPLWEGLRVCYQMTRKPYVLGAGLLMAGYISAALTRMERPMSKQLIRFQQQEQMGKLKALVRGLQIR